MKKDYNNITLERIDNAKIAIIGTDWNKEHIDRMIEVSEQLLIEAGAEVEIIYVPGTYEIPLVAKLLAKKKIYSAIITYGIIVKGDTDHYEVIRDTCINELGRIGVDYEVPIIMEILPVYKMEDAIARTTGSGNKGIEAAEATAKIINIVRNLT